MIELPSGEIVNCNLPNDNFVQIRPPWSGIVRLNLTGHTDIVHRLAYLSKSGLLASGSYDKTIKLWNVTTGELIKSWKAYNTFANKLIEMPNGDIVSAGGDSDPGVKVWSAANNFELNRTIELAGKETSYGLIRLSNGYLAVSYTHLTLPTKRIV